MNFKSQVLDSRPSLPFIGCVALARHLSGIKDDFQDRSMQREVWGGTAGGRRVGRLPPPSTCLSPIPSIAYLKKKLIVCNAFFFFCNRSTHNTCLGLPPLLRQLSFAFEGSSPQLELCRLAGRRAYGSRPEDWW